MQVIVINSQKGGSAKTMLAKHLSVEAERAGDGPVFLIDTDPQGSLTAWHTKREAEIPARVEVPFEGLEDRPRPFAEARSRLLPYRHRFRPDGDCQRTFEYSGFRHLPGKPSEDDLTAAPVTVQALKEIGVPFLFVLTRVKANTLITAQAAALLRNMARSPRLSSTTAPHTNRHFPRARPSPKPNTKDQPPGKSRRCGKT